MHTISCLITVYAISKGKHYNSCTVANMIEDKVKLPIFATIVCGLFVLYILLVLSFAIKTFEEIKM